MQVTYIFNTGADNYNDRDLRVFQRAEDMASALWDIKQYLRQVWKYQEDPDDINTIYERVSEIIIENGITDEILA